MSYARDEHIRADAEEAAVPDWVYEQRTCDDCGATLPKDEVERVGHLWLCPACLDAHKHDIPAIRHICALMERSDGGVA